MVFEQQPDPSSRFCSAARPASAQPTPRQSSQRSCQRAPAQPSPNCRRLPKPTTSRNFAHWWPTSSSGALAATPTPTRRSRPGAWIPVTWLDCGPRWRMKYLVAGD